MDIDLEKKLDKKDLEKMSAKELAEYKIALELLSLDVDNLIKKCDEALNK